jgi:hypothetical protein
MTKRTRTQIKDDIIAAQKQLIKNQFRQITIMKKCLTKLRAILK